MPYANAGFHVKTGFNEYGGVFLLGLHLESIFWKYSGEMFNLANELAAEIALLLFWLNAELSFEY